jgi:polyhydroxyalkanoate synthesis regulator protein
MQANYSKQWNEFYQSLNQPLHALTELHMDTLRKGMENSNDYMSNCLDAKSPEDLAKTNLKLMNELNTLTTQYMQNMTKAFTDFSKKMTEAMQKAATDTTTTGSSSGTTTRK